eukprot:m.185603 g.185603  ORF g.185603 m.185603 type:complete len:470 (-) comp16503_c0_seq1:143-1552(-)
MLAFVESSLTQTSCVAATPDFKVCFSGHQDCSVCEYDWFSSINSSVASHVAAPVKTAEWGTWDNGARQPDSVTSMAVHSKALWCLTGHKSGVVKLSTSRVDRGTCHARFANHLDAVTGVGLCADEHVAVTVSIDASLAITDLDSGKSYQFKRSAERQSDNGLRPFTGLATAPRAGTTFVAATSSDGTVPLWQVRGTQVEPVTIITAAQLGRRATCAAWGVDGLSVVVGCADGTVSKWDVRNVQAQVAGTVMPTTVPVGVVRGIETPYKCPDLLVGRNPVQSVLALREDFVAAATVDGVRVFRWSNVGGPGTKRPRVPVLFGSEGVNDMTADATGRFLFACRSHTNRSSSTRSYACMGYDLSETLGLPPPVAPVVPTKKEKPSSSSPVAPAHHPPQHPHQHQHQHPHPHAQQHHPHAQHHPLDATARMQGDDDGLVNGLGELLDEVDDFDLMGDIDFNDEDIFADFGFNM